MELKKLRTEIDSIDDEILQLLDKRMNIVKKIGKLKLKTDRAIYHPKREQEILHRLINTPKNTISNKGIQSIYQEIFATARFLELPERVAYLGPDGSFTHQVAMSKFGRISEYISCANIESIIKSVANNSVKYGVIPIENNSNGVVGESLDFLAKYDVKIVAESNLSVHHSLASNEKLLSNVKRIYSKDIAFGQCREFLNNYSLQNIELIPLDSTAKAAKVASNEPNSAAICSNIAANIFNLPIMFENIQDNDDNITRFFIISDFKTNPTANDKTSVCAFIDNSDKPGTLAKLLSDFHTKNINLVKLESRPLRKTKVFSFWFYIEFEGHIDNSNVKEVFNQIKDKLKWLGSYPKDTLKRS